MTIDLPPDILDSIKARSEIVGKCWLWQGPTNNTKIDPVPSMHFGRTRVIVRRIVLQARGRLLTRSEICAVKCGNPDCVSPACVYVSTRSAMGKKAARAGKFSGLARSMKISIAKRANSKIGCIEVARAIRARQHTITGADLAREHGVTKRVIHMIWAGQIWKDHANPFAQLASNESTRRRAA